MEKVCITCKETKALDEFHNDQRTPDKKCRECKICRNRRTREHHKHHYEANKESIKIGLKAQKAKRKERYNEFKKTLKCSTCEENEPCCLEFHHLDPNIKEIGIAQAVDHWSWKRLMTEIEKCVVLCSNCHKKVHAGKLDLT